MMRQNMVKGIIDPQASSTQQNTKLKQMTARRRITGVDLHNIRSAERVESLLQRMGKFMTESMWSSMYSRFYRMLLLTPKEEVCSKYGSYAEEMLVLIVFERLLLESWKLIFQRGLHLVFHQILNITVILVLVPVLALLLILILVH